MPIGKDTRNTVTEKVDWQPVSLAISQPCKHVYQRSSKVNAKQNVTITLVNLFIAMILLTNIHQAIINVIPP